MIGIYNSLAVRTLRVYFLFDQSEQQAIYQDLNKKQLFKSIPLQQICLTICSKGWTGLYRLSSFLEGKEIGFALPYFSLFSFLRSGQLNWRQLTYNQFIVKKKEKKIRVKAEASSQTAILEVYNSDMGLSGIEDEYPR